MEQILNIAIESDGTRQGTKVIDRDTERVLDNVKMVGWSLDTGAEGQDGFIATAVLEVYHVPLHANNVRVETVLVAPE